MRILITCELFPPNFTGGGETLIYKIAEKLVESGNEVKVLTTGNPKIKKYKNIETIRLPVNRYLMNLMFPVIAYYAKDVDIIQTTSGNACFPSWLASKISGKPVCCYVNHILGKNWKKIKGLLTGTIFEFLERIFLARSYDAIVFQNKSSKEIGARIGIKKNIFMLQPGLIYEKFHTGKKKPFVLFVGNFSMNKAMAKVKGLDNLTEAARNLSEVKFLIVGKGSYLNELKKTSPKNVLFKGPLTSKQLAPLYSQALIFCLPSLSEGFGLTILEAMASGCAIVSTIDLGQKGILTKSNSPEEIEHAIKKLVGNYKMAIRLGKRNRTLAKRFTWKNFINRLNEVYGLIS